jgi:hypothetical protein
METGALSWVCPSKKVTVPELSTPTTAGEMEAVKVMFPSSGAGLRLLERVIELGMGSTWWVAERVTAE